jgi:hypothetical protein
MQTLDGASEAHDDLAARGRVQLLDGRAVQRHEGRKRGFPRMYPESEAAGEEDVLQLGGRGRGRLRRA